MFKMMDRGSYLESGDEIPEPHGFTAVIHIKGNAHSILFEEHEHAGDGAQRDNNMRAAVIHVVADAAVSVLVITGLLLARAFGWLWMDPFPLFLPHRTTRRVPFRWRSIRHRVSRPRWTSIECAQPDGRQKRRLPHRAMSPQYGSLASC